MKKSKNDLNIRLWRRNFHKYYFDQNNINRANRIKEKFATNIIYRYRPARSKQVCPRGGSCESYIQHNEIDRLVSMIENDDFTIWLSHPYEFNDPYDTFVSTTFEDTDIFKFLLQKYAPKIIISTFKIPMENIEKYQNDVSNSIMANDSNVFATIVNSAINLDPNLVSEETRPKVTQILENATGNHFNTARMNFSRIMQSNIGIASFSEVKSSILMWSHYAENHTGYCLAYDRHDLENVLLERKGYGVFPVDYETSKSSINDLTTYISDIALKYPDKFIDACCKAIHEEDIESINQEITNNNWNAILKRIPDLVNILSDLLNFLVEDEDFIRKLLSVSTQKAVEWEYEKEWRLITPFTSDPTLEERLIHIHPTCIYLGAKMSEEDKRKIMKAMSVNKCKIPLKEMWMYPDRFALNSVDSVI